jgi:hypothetical protein
MNPALIPLALQMKYPIVVIDAIGRSGLDPAAHKLLSTNAKREVAMNAEAFNRNEGTRPEVVIPLPISQEPPVAKDMDTLAVGQQVRLVRAPNIGGIGTITNILPGLTMLANGLKTPAAEVRFDAGDTLVLPLVNLEIVG